MNWIKTNRITKILFSNYIWEIPNKSKKVYLTFDDGPIPVVTEWVLDTLKKENIKATFFALEIILKNILKFLKELLTKAIL